MIYTYNYIIWYNVYTRICIYVYTYIHMYIYMYSVLIRSSLGICVRNVGVTRCTRSFMWSVLGTRVWFATCEKNRSTPQTLQSIARMLGAGTDSIINVISNGMGQDHPPRYGCQRGQSLRRSANTVDAASYHEISRWTPLDHTFVAVVRISNLTLAKWGWINGVPAKCP